MDEEKQVAFSFDSVTLKRIGKGALHAIGVAILLGLLDYGLQISKEISSNNVFIVMFMGWFSTTGYNTIKEWVKGI